MIPTSVTVDDTEIATTIAECYHKHNGYHLCPHTATAAAYCWRQQAMQKTNRVVIATASCQKFADVYARIDTVAAPRLDEHIRALMTADEHVAHRLTQANRLEWTECVKKMIVEMMTR